LSSAKYWTREGLAKGEMEKVEEEDGRRPIRPVIIRSQNVEWL